MKKNRHPDQQQTESAHKEKPEQVQETRRPDDAPAPETESDVKKNLLQKSKLSEEAIKELQAKAAEADRWRDRALRAMAELENLRKRHAREREEIRRYAAETLLQKLIPVLDSFEMALQSSGENRAVNPDSILQGMTMIRDQLKKTLAEMGLHEIDAAGQEFDHNFHEAVMVQETKDAPEGRVLQQLRKGYRLHDRLLRPAGVVVAKRPEGATEEDSEEEESRE